MHDVLATSMALKQTSAAAAVGVTRSYEVGPADAVELTLVVLSVAGTAPNLNAFIELSNDRENWTPDASYGGAAYLGYFAVAATQVAARWLRVRLELTSSGADGAGVFSFTARRAEL